MHWACGGAREIWQSVGSEGNSEAVFAYLGPARFALICARVGGGWGQPTSVWVTRTGGAEAASRRGEERRVCAAMSACPRGRCESCKLRVGEAWAHACVCVCVCMAGVSTWRGGEHSPQGGGSVAQATTCRILNPSNTCPSVTQNTTPQDSAGNCRWSAEICPYPLSRKETVKSE